MLTPAPSDVTFGPMTSHPVMCGHLDGVTWRHATDGRGQQMTSREELVESRWRHRSTIMSTDDVTYTWQEVLSLRPKMRSEGIA